ncbi:hypothetical protein BS47DRAFT_1352137 [Hydnum rufescens UP504]|uniref:Macrofage activating glycoprotein n=1 Tax=Hydnum rufescens UP504 TaxID=1448309 RepID=A0A9P6AJK4_9AGAM|nr:hypothetical protein BS47DRAFT_1352137 [Hydnum rufescens UP504]
MSIHTLSLSLLAATTAVVAQTIIPLTQRIFPYANIPYQVDTDPTGRGPQSGYNICNSTTEGPNSQCQTALINNIADFCVWGPATFNSTIGDTEAASVAWCSKPGHGSRVMTSGTLTGVQFLKAPAYVQVTGLINQVNINIAADDGGGELDPHGADERGNPLGALVYTNAFPSNNGNNNTYQQVIQWHNFMGSDVFCFKACDPAVATSAQYCNNLFDRIGCSYVAPASYAPNEYTVCDSDNQDPPGVYTNSAGVVTTYTQPPESLGPISTLPYVAKIPATSNCVTFQSAQLYASESSASSSTSSVKSTSAKSTTSVTGKSGSGSGSPTSTSTSKSSSAARPIRSSPFYGAGTGMFIAVSVSVMAGLGAVVVIL